MSRLRRVSLRVEHRSVSVSITQTSTTSDESSMPGNPDRGSHPGNCPVCGAPWLPDFSAALNEWRISLELLQTALRDNRLHLQHLPGGHLRVCERSFQTIKETNP